MPDNPSGGDGRLDHGHRRPNGSNGVRPRGMTVHPVPFEEIEDPIDLVAVQADDELINALAAGMSVSSPGVGGYDADDRVAAILAAWKADVDAGPIPELVDLDTAVSTVIAARPPSRRARHLAPLAAAAAFIVLAIGGLSVGSYNAQPQDALWPVTRVLYSERAESVEAAVRVEEHIANAKEALVAGEPVVAARELAQAEAELVRVRPEEGRTELAETQDFLVAKAAETPQGRPTNPGTPLATQPSRPVPSGAAIPGPAPAESPSPTGGTDVSGTPVPVRPVPSGTPDRPDGSSTTADPRRGAVAPEDTRSSASATPTPDDPSRGGEGEADDSDETRSPDPTATSEGQPDEPTTSPESSGSSTPSSGGTSGTTEGASGPSTDDSGSTGATATGVTASGSEAQPASTTS